MRDFSVHYEKFFGILDTLSCGITISLKLSQTFVVFYKYTLEVKHINHVVHHIRSQLKAYKGHLIKHNLISYVLKDKETQDTWA